MKKIFYTIIPILIFLLSFSFVNATNTYLETFSNTVNQTNLNIIDGWYWAADDGGDSDTSGRQIGLLSNINGVNGYPGFVYNYTSSQSNIDGVVVWLDLDEINLILNQRQLNNISAYFGHNNSDIETRFLIRIETSSGPEWYVTTSYFVMPNPFNVACCSDFQNGAVSYQISFDTSGSNWAELDYDGLNGVDSTGFNNLSGAISGLATDLPEGDITALGVYYYLEGSRTARFDNFSFQWEDFVGVTYDEGDGDGAVPVDLNEYLPGDNLIVLDPADLSKNNYNFSGWLDLTTDTIYQPGDSIIISDNLTLVAQWSITEHTLTTSSNTGGSITNPGESTFTYDIDTVVNLVATPDQGFNFVEWTGDTANIADTTNPETTITMSSDAIIMVVFEPVSAPRRSGGGGTTVQSRIANLEQVGNLEEANLLRQTFNVQSSAPQQQQLTLPQIVELLISLGFITPDRATLARQAVQTLTSTTAQTPTTPTTTPQQPITPGRFQFTRDLQLNDTGTDVIALQQFLNHRNFLVNETPGEPGSLGNETAFFGERTRQALIRYQQANNITPADGILNQTTRDIANPTIRWN